MTSEVKLIECPRDAWQGLRGQIPTAAKAKYLRDLQECGFKHIDAVSFVSPKAVPQMADSEEVLKLLAVHDDVELIGIVVNEKGAQRAIDTEKVTTIGFPYSVSETFLRKNQNQSFEECLDQLEAAHVAAYKAGLGTVAYISMAFGNPYGDDWNPGEVVEACGIIADLGIEQISLADTVGLADANLIRSVVGEVRSRHDHLEIGVHLHSRAENASEKILAAYEVGCRRFDAALGGIGGCPFAQDVLVGNIATEQVIATLQGQGAKLPRITRLDTLTATSAEIAATYGGMARA